jgi:hypothetical protein
MHYRRYFCSSPEPFLYKLKRLIYYPIGLFKKRFGLIYTENTSFWKHKIITKEEIIEILKRYEAIMPMRPQCRYSIEEHYRRCHDREDLDAIKDYTSS